MRKLHITKRWAKRHEACEESFDRFFERWPEGLPVTRKNILMAAHELPIGDLVWLAEQLLQPRRSEDAWEKWSTVNDQFHGLMGSSVRSEARKLMAAKALADALNL